MAVALVPTGAGAGAKSHETQMNFVTCPLLVLIAPCRLFIGRCAGMEYAPRLLPLWLADRVLFKALGVDRTAATLRENGAKLATKLGINRNSSSSSDQQQRKAQ